MYHRKHRAAMACCLALVATATVSQGAIFETCNGVPINWASPPGLAQNTCSIPSGSAASTAVANGFQQWTSIAPVAPGLGGGSILLLPTTDCSCG